jgi:hypothetical protein
MSQPIPIRYRKRPVVVDAIQWTGNNIEKIWDTFGAASLYGPTETNVDSIMVRTLEGVMRAALGDWIIRGVKGELYPCKPDIFEATYEPAGEEASRG